MKRSPIDFGSDWVGEYQAERRANRWRLPVLLFGAGVLAWLLAAGAFLFTTGVQP